MKDRERKSARDSIRQTQKLRNTDKNSEREIEKKWKNKTKGEGGKCVRGRES